MKLKEMMEKYKDIVPYAIFGILTTIINIVVYLFFAHILKKEVMLSTLAAWFLSVLFAYVTNRKWVFHSGVLHLVILSERLWLFLYVVWLLVLQIS